MNLDVALIPKQARNWHEKVCIVVDVLRASSTIVTLLEGGVSRIYPTRNLTQARKLARRENCVLAGERDGIAPADFDFGNSPTELAGANLAGKQVVLSTSNGTVVLDALRNSSLVLVGCFLNAHACCQVAVKESIRREVGLGIVCAGTLGEFVLDDAVCVGYLVDETRRLMQIHQITPVLNDAAQAAYQLFQSYPNVLTAFLKSKSGKRLIEIGDAEDSEFCSQIDISQKVPVLIPGKDAQLIIQPYAS